MGPHGRSRLFTSWTSQPARPLGRLTCWVSGVALITATAPAAMAEGGLSIGSSGACVNLPGASKISAVQIAPVVRRLRSAGVRKVRIPLYAERYVSGSSAPFRVDHSYLDRIKDLAHEFTSSGFEVILDAHDFRSVKQNPQANTPKLTAFWKAAALQWSGLPKTVSYEILNEPALGITGKNLYITLSPSILEIRRIDRSRELIVGGANYSHFSSLTQVGQLLGPNITPTFHFYDPLAFTHQGAKWQPRYRHSGQIHLPPSYEIAIARAVESVRSLRARTGRTPLVGEIGVIANAPANERIEYIQRATAAFASEGMTSCLWSWPVDKDDFDIRSLVS